MLLLRHGSQLRGHANQFRLGWAPLLNAFPSSNRVEQQAQEVSQAACCGVLSFHRALFWARRQDACLSRRGLSRRSDFAAQLKGSGMMDPPKTTPCAAANATSPAVDSSSSAEDSEPLIQYVVLRRDLKTDLSWPLGAVVAQACHAAVAALGSAIEDHSAVARQYLADGCNMRTVVLQVSSEKELLQLRDKLTELRISHKLWEEEPEKIPTALASAPIKKSAGKAFRGLKLLS
ncbi:hypothetical protein Efla_003610 [Eimeria flavescens]